MRSPGWIKRFDWWHELTLLVLLIGLMSMAGALMPRFVNVGSQLLLSKQLWEMAILALPMTLIIITGGIDLSVGSTMGLCAVAFGIAFQQTESVIVSSVLCILVGAVCGGFNGFLISRFRVHPLITTLATYAAFRGIAAGISQGKSYSRFGATQITSTPASAHCSIISACFLGSPSVGPS